MTAFNHVGVTVPDLDAAMRWYVAVFGLRLIEGPDSASLSTPGGSRRADVFGPAWKEMRIAHLVTEEEAGIELFQFTDPPVEKPPDNFAYWRIGVFHIALTVGDVDGTAAEIARTGGKRRTDTHTVRPGCVVCYCEDPWGNVLELSSRSYIETHPPVVAR